MPKSNELTDVHVITNFTHLGGAESMLLRLLSTYQDNSNVLLVSLMQVSDEMKRRIPSGVKCLELGSKGPVSMLLNSFRLRKKIHGARVVYSWMYHANFSVGLASLTLMKRPKIIWGVRHSLDDLRGESFSTRVAIEACRLLAFTADKVVYCSKRALKQHEDYGFNLPSKSVYIPNGYVFPELGPKDFNKVSWTFGAAGRFHPAKDYKSLFMCMSQILRLNPSHKLLLCGRGIDDSNEVLKAYMQKFKISTEQVSLLGILDDMNSFYDQVDIFVLSSKTEGFPNVLAEAAAQGCTIFSTDVGDAAKIVADESRTIEIEQPELMATAIKEYLDLSPINKEQVAMQSCLHVRENYSLENISRKFFALRG